MTGLNRNRKRRFCIGAVKRTIQCNFVSAKGTKKETKTSFGAVVVAQLAKRLLQIPENPGSNTVIGRVTFMERLFPVDQL